MKKEEKRGILGRIENNIRKIILGKYRFSFLFIISLIFAFLFASATVSALYTTTVFYDGFDGNNLTTNGWTITGNSTINNWTIISSSHADGTNASECGRTDNSNRYVSILTKNMSSTGFYNLTLSFSRNASNLDSADYFKVEYWNGSSWAVLFNSLGSSLNDLAWNNFTYNLNNSDNLANFGVRFSCSASGSLEFCRIDAVNISGAVPLPLSVVYLSQFPSQVTSLNLFNNTYLNITYNITGDSLNATSPLLFYKTNQTGSDVSYYVNGTSVSGFATVSYLSVSSSNYLFRLVDNQVYPATYNYPERSMELTPHSFVSLTSTSQYLSVGLRNVSSIAPYGIFEIMMNKTTLASTSTTLYYCNSTYNFLSNIGANSNCIAFAVASNNNYNHNHSNFSSHQIFPFAVNITDGTLNGIVVTPNSFFLIQGNAIGWNVHYISNLSRTGAIRTTNNNGATWTNQTYTVDAHLHQYTGNDFLYYYACANDTNGTFSCSTVRQNQIALAQIIPSPPIIFSPINQTYIGNIPINYTQAVSPTGNAIVNYSIYLYNIDETFNTTIILNNGLNLGYIWNSSSVPDDSYKIKVVATDNRSLSSFSFSQIFTTHNTICIQNWSKHFTPCGSNINLSCGTFDNSTIYYTDLNICHNATGVPTDNGTCSFCDFCTPNWQCTNFLNCTNFWSNCTSVADAHTPTCCNLTGLNSDCNFTDFNQFRRLCGNMITYFTTNADYPYVDCNSTQTFGMVITINGIRQNFEHLYFEFPTIPYRFNWTWVNATLSYTITLQFTTEGDYPFVIWSDYPYGVMQNITGTLKVRCPFSVNVRVFQINPKNQSNPYINNFAYITAEFPDNFGIPYVNANEFYARPIGFKQLFMLQVFHSQYSSGLATLKLWERDREYAFRLIDGQINFYEGVYSKINMTKSYGTNIYLGTIKLNGTSEDIYIFLKDNEIYPYRTLINWLWAIFTFIAIIGAIILLFIPPYTFVAFPMGIGAVVLFSLARLMIWIIWRF